MHKIYVDHLSFNLKKFFFLGRGWGLFRYFSLDKDANYCTETIASSLFMHGIDDTVSRIYLCPIFLSECRVISLSSTLVICIEKVFGLGSFFRTSRIPREFWDTFMFFFFFFNFFIE